MTKKLRPKSKYFLFPPKHSLDSISCCYGFDRGTPVDRYYIEKFLEENKDEIRGRCLEITDNVYTRRFGKNRVKKSDVLDIDKKNNKANIHGDLRDLKEIKNDVYDCVIATHTFGVIDEYQKAVKECYRILKPGGTLVATVSALGVAVELEKSFWRFTETSVRYVFGKFFGQENIKVCSLGNVLSGQAFWVGLAAEELSEEELNYNDPRYSIIVGVIANK
ncbi:MAG: methyltransferase domain-containing protein [Patescibacteria group bacterium]|nr:methyltransferase domain-containing protein [Patescibacteria group bacterium]